MTRINTNVNSIIAQRVLGQQNAKVANSLERLSTGLAINKAADSPSGLIASENMRADLTTIKTAITNNERAEDIISIAEGGLIEVQDQLNTLLGLVTQASSRDGLSPEERDAVQLQIDGILGSVDRIANQTSFQGVKLLNGNFEFVVSGMTASHIDEFQVNAALLPDVTASVMLLDVRLDTSAQTALTLISAGGGTNFDTFSGQTVTFEITGNLGTTQLAFASGTTVTEAASSINQFRDLTGVSASTSSANGAVSVVLHSRQLGTDQFVAVRHVEGSAYEARIFIDDGTGTAVQNSGLANGRDAGRDAVVRINGIEAAVTGTVAKISQPFLDIEMRLDTTFNTSGNSTSFNITSGGAKFNLGPRSELASKYHLGLNSVSTGQLGNAVDGRLAALKSGGTANLVDGDYDRAQRITESAIRRVSTMRGGLGSFITNTVRTTVNSLGIALENTAAAESAVRDTDFATETGELTRRQILSQAATNSLAIANAQSQSALSLLG